MNGARAAPGTTRGLFGPLPASLPAEAPGHRRAACFPHRWLCIGLPWFALECLDTGTTSDPVAVVDGHDRQRRVYVANAAARGHGVRRGMGLDAAYALCPTLTTATRQVRRETARLEELAAWADRFTPWVSIEAPAALLLEVRGSLGLFGGADALCTQVATALEAKRHEHRLALAPTPTAALWLSRTGRRVVMTCPDKLPGRLGELPLRCLGWPDKTVTALQGMGVRSVRDCLRLPRAGLARRFGRRCLAELDRALGLLPDPRPSFSAPARFSRSLELPAETTDTVLLLTAAERLLETLTAYLIARQAGVQEIGLRFAHVDQPATRTRIGLIERCQDVGRLLSLVRLRLESLTLPAPVVDLTLSSGPVTTLACRERSLFAGHSGGASGWPVLLETLRTRLGATAVFGVADVADHRPESAWRRIEPGAAASASATGGGMQFPASNAAGHDRPLWLLARPRRLKTIGGRPDCDGRLVCERGPERIETGWWDGADVVRDYYVARDRHGSELWIYRERRAPRDWYLHGYFG